MHAENRYAAVDYFHFIKSSNISDGSAAAHIYLAKLCSLEKYIVIVENLADSCHILSVSIIGTGFSAGSSKLVQHNTSSKICRILFLKSFCKCRIISSTYIRGEHAGILQRLSQSQVRILSQCIQNICYAVLKETGLHTGSSYASDLFLINQQTAACTLWSFHLKKSQKGSVCANSVILSVTSNHAAVKSAVTGLASRHNFKLCGKEIFLFHTIFLIQDAKNILFHSFFLLIIRKICKRTASNEDI